METSNKETDLCPLAETKGLKREIEILFLREVKYEEPKTTMTISLVVALKLTHSRADVLRMIKAWIFRVVKRYRCYRGKI